MTPRSRYRAAAFTTADIYPCGWEDSDDVADWMVGTFRDYAATRRRGYGMLLAIV